MTNNDILPTESYTPEQAADLKRVYGIDVPEGSIVYPDHDPLPMSDEYAVYDACNAAIRVCQEHLGQTDGGFASLHFDDTFNGISIILQDYIEAELGFHADEVK